MKLSRRILACMVLQLGVALTASAATRIDLNQQWSFIDQPKEAIPLRAPQAIPPTAEIVNLPHTWNRAGAHYDALGQFWYFKQLDLPKLPDGGIAQLHFGAAFYKARVFLNGVQIGEHEGGYHEFSFDVSTQLRESNVLAVLVDNRPGMFTIPGFGARGAPDAWYDWWAYGGLVRGVWLDLHGPVRISNQFIRSTLKATNATVSNRVSLVSRGARTNKLRATVIAPDGTAANISETGVTLKDGVNEIPLSIPLKNIKRWDLDHPNLYRMKIEVLDSAGMAIETASSSFGLRDIEIRDRHLLINGQRVRLTGMTRHADSPWEGLAESKGTLSHDWEDMKSLNMTLTRPVHYAPDPWAADFADERGILLIPEIPVWQASEAQMSNPQYLALAKAQYRELIEQYGNHPSVFAWSVFNESAAGTPGGIKFFREMRDYIKSLDPQRYVTLADDNLPKLARAEESAANDADFLMMNQYFGAWHGPREALGPALDKVDRLFPTKMVIISELGFPGIFARNATEADAMRVSILREQLPMLAKRDWIAGAILWCYQDYKSRRYFWPGQEQGYLEHGIVDQDRQRKPSYFAWKELNAPARIEIRWTQVIGKLPTDFEVKLTPNTPTELPYVPLRDYKVTWALTGAENRAFASGTQPLGADETLTFRAVVPQTGKNPVIQVVVKLIRPDGSVAMERSLASQ